MPAPQIRPQAERFAALLMCVTQAVASRTGWALSAPLIALIATRLRTIKWRFLRLAARIGAGTYIPRAPSAQPRAKAADRPRPAPPRDKLPRKFGWLRPLIPEAVMFAGMLDALLREPDMVALMEAAPAAMCRPIRSICRMLGVPPPPILAPPPRRKPAPRARREKPPPLARSRLGFHRGLPTLPPFTGRFASLPPAKKPA
jgi:hypothetical protein